MCGYTSVPEDRRTGLSIPALYKLFACLLNFPTALRCSLLIYFLIYFFKSHSVFRREMVRGNQTWLYFFGVYFML